jgi:VIT1/CCC1 family predicted Fe2+/Mn2+ transporter
MAWSSAGFDSRWVHKIIALIILDIFIMKQEGKHPHTHFTASNTVRDVIIGMSDGLTVPFALAAGLSGVVSTTNIIVIAGFAEIAAGCISMGLGGYLAAQSDAEYYDSERKKEDNEIKNNPQYEKQEVVDVFKSYGFNEQEISPVLKNFENNTDNWVDFMMHNELHLDKPSNARARNSGLTIASSYFIAGLIPLSPYIFIPEPATALAVSAAVTLLALIIFGYAKARLISNNPWPSAWRTVLTGAVAAAAAYLIARAIS